jgi:hypothetical protein
MANILNTLLKQVMTGDTVKDWNHASQTFVANNYALAPKSSFLYHVYFDINSNAMIQNNVSDSNKKQELGMMVKQVSLPKFTVDTKSLNAYNREHLVQSKIHYDPVNITFHDDSSDVVRNFWFDYYAYYYRNSDQGGSTNLAPMNGIHQEMVNARIYKDWGYTIRAPAGAFNSAPYLNSIRIYSLYNKQFSEYTLVNPIIKSFQHGDHSSSATTETMSHQMTVEFETVFYAHGYVSASSSGSGTVMGFGDIHYDHRPSPLTPAGGGTKSILGPGGLIQSADEVIQDLQAGNIGAAVFKGTRAANTLQGSNLLGMAAIEGINLLKGTFAAGSTGTNPFGSVQIPSLSNLGNIGSISSIGSFLSTKLNSKSSSNPGLPSTSNPDPAAAIGATNISNSPPTYTAVQLADNLATPGLAISSDAAANLANLIGSS